MKLTATPYGTLLILIGLGAFAITGFDSYTALIPCGFGLLALVLTRVGGKVGWISLLVLGIAAIGGSARDIANFGKLFDGSHGKPVAGWAQLAMFVLSVLFVLTMLMPAGKAKGK
tara:strand:- start:3469 stop:3813 length:345 start_codon:yes stop_codon:yes gene_type:complete